MSREGPFFHFYPSDWLAGTRGMTAAETGVYITLIAMMYERGQPLAFNKPKLARLCGTTPAAFDAILGSLVDDEKIIELPEGLWNHRVGIECEKRHEKTRAAQASANARWRKTQQKQSKRNASAEQTQCGTDANQIPDTREEVSSNEDTPRFDEIADAVNTYNAAADRTGWPKVQKLTPNRRQLLKARLSDAGGIEGWRIAVEKAEVSRFIRGPNRWFSFDWLSKQGNFTKLMEGNYDDNRPGSPQSSDPDAGTDGLSDAQRIRQAQRRDRGVG